MLAAPRHCRGGFVYGRELALPSGPLEEASQLADQSLGCARRQPRSRAKLGQAVEPGRDLRLIARNGYASDHLEAPASRYLMIVASLAQACPARQHQDRLLMLHREQDGPGPRMSDDRGRFLESPLEGIRLEEGFPIDAGGWASRGANLREDIAPLALLSPHIYRMNEAIEGHLRTDRDEDHSTAPE